MDTEEFDGMSIEDLQERYFLGTSNGVGSL